jgi:formamidopyrimidine-DNA glycosylase
MLQGKKVLDMPELPEVETVVRSLRPGLVARMITAVEVYLPKMIKFCAVEELKRQVVGRKIIGITRRGKYFIIKLTGGWLLVGHLRMTGRLTIANSGEPFDKYIHVVFMLDNHTELRFADMRQFGCLYMIHSEEVEKIKGLAALGPEPLAEELTLEIFKAEISNKKVKMKQLLLNQQFVAGIGNIYADEILFAAGVNPNRTAASLTQEEINRIYQSMREVLALGIKYRGTSIKDYVDGSGIKGEFQHRLKVYGRTNQACLTCGTILVREKIGGRSTHYCPKCQL